MVKKSHGEWDTKLYWRYHKMLDRCRNPNNEAYSNYGGRGITVCDRWLVDAPLPKGEWILHSQTRHNLAGFLQPN